MSELSPLQKEILNRFLTNYKEGGIEACQAMVNDLAAEVEMAAAASEGAGEIHHETILAQVEMTIDEIIARLSTLNSIPTAAIDAMSRYSFALFLLRIVERETDAA